MFLDLTSVVLLTFCVIHLWSHKFHPFIYKSELIATSFSGGMAIASVFLQLLPELEKSHQLLGVSVHFICLLGFLLFYGMQRLVFKTKDANFHHDYIFYIEIAFYCLYNFLLIYAIPESLEQDFSFVFLYLIAMCFHLLHSNYTFLKKYPQKFKSLGRYLVVASVVAGFTIDLLAESTNEFIADFLIAALSGSIMFNVFDEELPSPKNSSLRWFIAGIISYLFLLTGSLTIT